VWVSSIVNLLVLWTLSWTPIDESSQPL
jgi:hypothetical protein